MCSEVIHEPTISLSTNQLQLVIRLTPLHPHVIVGVYTEIKLMCNLGSGCSL
jgi:hypothetical protein